MEKKKVILVIFDGWGIAPSGEKDASAIEKAATPFMDKIWKEQPHSRLKADGIAVGLPEGQMGNSEVGHINIGAGRVVYQMLVKINKAIEEGNLHKNKQLLNAFEIAKKQNKKVHIIGLVSDGGIHSHIRHLEALLEIAAEHQVKELFVHAITDGRDTDPKSGIGFLEEIEEHLQETTGKLASIMGRYYAMDRGGNWKRTAKAYDALVRGTADTSVEAGKWKEALREKYENLETDEFIDPMVLTEGDKPVATINEGDVVICFNYRPDRMRQITQALTQQDFPDVEMDKMDLHFLTMTTYDRNYKNVTVLFEADDMKFTLGEVLSSQGKKQIRIAESIKYPHVTYFFNGGREEPFEGEERIMVDTVDVSTFDKAPQMSAMDIRDAIIPKLKEGYVDFVCLNFANADMVGHSGDIEATIKACETVDSCAAAIAKVALENDYAMIIIADHGNAEKMKNTNGSPFTAHTTNPVPCILLRNGEKLELNDGQLADIAPTVLALMGIDIPEEMSGQVLVNSSKK